MRTDVGSLRDRPKSSRGRTTSVSDEYRLPTGSARRLMLCSMVPARGDPPEHAHVRNPTLKAADRSHPHGRGRSYTRPCVPHRRVPFRGRRCGWWDWLDLVDERPDDRAELAFHGVCGWGKNLFSSSATRSGAVSSGARWSSLGSGTRRDRGIIEASRRPGSHR
jgi:hypothetical protein